MEKPRFIRKNGRIIPIYSKQQKKGAAQVAAGAGVVAATTAAAATGLAVSRKKNFQAYSNFSIAKNLKKTMDLITQNTIRSGRNFNYNAQQISDLGVEARKTTIAGNKLRKAGKLLRAGSLGVAGLGLIAGATLIQTGADNIDSKDKGSSVAKNATVVAGLGAITYGTSRFKGTKKLAKLAVSKFK